MTTEQADAISRLLLTFNIDKPKTQIELNQSNERVKDLEKTISELLFHIDQQSSVYKRCVEHQTNQGFIQLATLSELQLQTVVGFESILKRCGNDNNIDIESLR
jgi:SHS2 domain-containing protein